MVTKRGTSRTKRRAASVAGIVAALAVAVPVAQASAATPPIPLPPIPGLPADIAPPYSFVALPLGGAAVAKGPTVIGDTFNGGTTVVVSNSPAAGSTNGSP
jgi:hypothetical protein